MATQFEFDSHQQTALEVPEVLQFLFELKQKGLQVTKDETSGAFNIKISERDSIRISLSTKRAQIQRRVWGDMATFRDVHSAAGVRDIASQWIHEITGQTVSNWKPKTVRTNSHTTATNHSMIAKLVGHTKIEGVFDPYLDNRGLQVLTDIISLGGVELVDNDIRLLTSAKVTSEGSSPRLTATFVKSWFNEHGVRNGEFKVTASAGHRRFLLLSNGESLILGFSPNNMAHDEAAHVELNPADRKFFDSQWVDSATYATS